MGNEPRKHHFVPAFYLAGFTARRTQDDSLTCTDLSEGRQFRGTPRSLGYVKDLYRIEHPEIEPNVVEHAFEGIEGKVAPALARIVASPVYPAQEDIAVVLNLVAMLVLRVPAIRQAYSSFIAEVVRKTVVMSMREPSTYEAFLESRRAAGEDVSTYRSYEEVKAVWSKGDHSLKIDESFVTASTVQLMPMIYDWLAARSWSLIRIDQMQSGPIITSDRPVVLYSTKPLPPLTGPGFGMRHTEVIFPLDRRSVLIGRWDEPERLIDGGGSAAFALNRRILADSHRFLYSPSGWFRFDGGDLGLQSSKQLLADVRDRRLAETETDVASAHAAADDGTGAFSTGDSEIDTTS